MPLAANLYQVMIASPSDVVKERRIVREVIHEWNGIYSLQRGFVLLPVSWETHSSPEMGSHPQSIINRQVLEDCDLLVGIFWTRLGSHTESHPSGTVEEIEKHLSASKQAMLYFSNEPVHPQSIDQNQYAALSEFKLACTKRGLFHNYSNLSEFHENFRRHLHIKVSSEKDFHSPQGTSMPFSEALETQSYHDERTSSLSREAQTLLVEASKDQHGTLMHLRFMDGTAIEVNGVNFTEGADARTLAKWEAALEQLNEFGLIVERGHKHEVFQITDKGYRVADLIKSRG